MSNYIYGFIILFILFGCKKNQLSEMNNVPMPKFEELISPGISKDSLKILIVGNSITRHTVAEEIGWHYNSGMAASEESNDYVHLLFKKLTKHYPTKKIHLRYSNWSQLEKAPETFSNFNMAIGFNPNIVIFQLSDNLNPETLKLFTKKSIKFLNNFDRKYVVSPFFMHDDNYNYSQKIASKSNSTFIDISNISKNNLNRAINDLRSDKSIWRAEGIGNHPGNTGMINISNTIYNYITTPTH